MTIAITTHSVTVHSVQQELTMSMCISVLHNALELRVNFCQNANSL